MKWVYICRTRFKNGGLGSDLSLKMGGFQSGHSREKTGDFGAKNNKETLIHVFKRGSFRSAQVGKAEQRIVYFLKGHLLERPMLKK